MSTDAEQQLLHHARNGNAEEVRQLLEIMESKEVIADINCKGKPWMYFFTFSCEYALDGSVVKICLPMQKIWVQSLGWKDALEKEMATHSSILAWGMPSTEDPGGP